MKDKVKIIIESHGDIISKEYKDSDQYCGDMIEDFLNLLEVAGFHRESINTSLVEIAEEIKK